MREAVIMREWINDSHITGLKKNDSHYVFATAWYIFRKATEGFEWS